MTSQFDGDDEVVEPRRLPDAYHQQRRDEDDDDHRRDVEDRTGRRPRTGVGVVAQRRRDQFRRQIEAKIPGKADEIARPSNRDRDRAYRVFEDQVPADDPGDEFAERRVGIGIGAAADRNGRRHLGVAQPGECAGDGTEHERQCHRGTGVRRRRVPGQHEDARADDSANAEGHEIERGQRTPEMVNLGVAFRLQGFLQQVRRRFSRPDACQNRVLPAWAAAPSGAIDTIIARFAAGRRSGVKHFPARRPLAKTLAPLLLKGEQPERLLKEAYHAGTDTFGCGSI